jgi:hypothetical protein
MLNAYNVRFDMTVIAEDAADASDRVTVWRSIAVACGHEPGAAVVKQIPDDRLDHVSMGQLERARLAAAQVATPEARERAIRALSTHLEGDYEAAERIVAEIEGAAGQLPIVVGRWLTEGRRALGPELEAA